MLRKLQHQISRKTKGTTVACKCRFDFDLHAVEGCVVCLQRSQAHRGRAPVARRIGYHCRLPLPTQKPPHDRADTLEALTPCDMCAHGGMGVHKL